MNFLPLKHPLETFMIEVDFKRFASSLVGAWVNVYLHSGADANPSAIKSGGAIPSGSVVSQAVTGGLDAVQYLLQFKATDGVSTWVYECVLPVGVAH